MGTLDAILLGGGLGKRFGSPKQFQTLGNSPVFIHALRGFLDMDCFRQIVLAFPESHLDQAREMIDSLIPPQNKSIIRVIAGGNRRQDSSCLALAAIEEMTPLPTRVLIHDACRPFLSRDFLERVKGSLLDRAYGAWVPVVPVVDTLKKVEKNQVIETVDRETVQRVQTPQIFEYAVIRSLAEKAKRMQINFTDDASLCEYYGIPVGTFEGDVRNIKLTYDFELETLKRMLTSEEKCDPEPATTYTV